MFTPDKEVDVVERVRDMVRASGKPNTKVSLPRSDTASAFLKGSESCTRKTINGILRHKTVVTPSVRNISRSTC